MYAKVCRVALAKVGDHLAKRRERTRAWLIDDEVAVECRMIADASDQCVKFRPLPGIVERRRRQQPVLKLRSQPMPLGIIEFFLPAPHQIPAPLSHLPGYAIGHRRPGPVGHNRRPIFHELAPSAATTISVAMTTKAAQAASRVVAFSEFASRRMRNPIECQLC